MTPLPELGRAIPHQPRAVSPMTRASDDFLAEDVESNDTCTASSESSDNDSSSQDGSDASTSDGRALRDATTFDGGALRDASTPDGGADPHGGPDCCTPTWSAHVIIGRWRRDSGGTYYSVDQGAQPGSISGNNQCDWAL